MRELQNFSRKKKHKELSTELSPWAEQRMLHDALFRPSKLHQAEQAQVKFDFRLNVVDSELWAQRFLVTPRQKSIRSHKATILRLSILVYASLRLRFFPPHPALFSAVRAKYETPVFSFCRKVVSTVIITRRNYDLIAVSTTPTPPIKVIKIIVKEYFISLPLFQVVYFGKMKADSTATSNTFPTSGYDLLYPSSVKKVQQSILLLKQVTKMTVSLQSL